MAERFYRVAFYDDEARQEQPSLVRWDWPLSVYIEGGTEADQAFVMQHVATLAKLTGLEYWRSENDSAPLRVSFVDDKSIENCRVNLVTTPSAPIPIHSFIRIRNDLDQTTKNRCIVQEITQSLGLLYDLDGRTDTAFVSGDGPIYLTTTDVALLEILYSDRLRPGMTVAEAMPIVRELADSQEQAARR